MDRLPSPASHLPVWTIGHSNQAFEKFLATLRAHTIELVVDVRRFPVSRRWPQFDRSNLEQSLPSAGVSYSGMPELGGRRRASRDSPHRAWRVEGFRGYADFMDTPDFAAALERLMTQAREKRAAIMCAEALPWRCHRSLIADAFLARGWEVFDILSERERRSHRFPEFARVDGTRVIYDG